MIDRKPIKISKTLPVATCLLAVINLPGNPAQASYQHADSRQPRYLPAVGQQKPTAAATMSPQNVPDFADHRKQAPGNDYQGRINTESGAGTALKADLASTTIPVQTRMKLVLETAIDARSSQPGDIFEAHVKDDMYLGMTLLLPRGSLVRGRVAQVIKPRLLSRAGKIGLKLEQIATPQGEVIPLDANLEFKKGVTNKRGELDPGTNFGTRVENSVRSVSGLTTDGKPNGALLAANIATLGAPVVATALGSSAIALFSQGDNVSLGPGQELEVLLTNDLGLQIN
ncbi:MAG: TrbI/VirB10 family protein [Candidatus Obscuribacterales bacterium]|nr:TrbI/VirB10 family protein [Candidatus Obscuribacterales bacterium]